VVVADAELQASKEWTKKNITGQLPLLEVGETTICETIAICKYLARVSPEGGNLLGTTPLEQARVEQLLSYSFT